MKSRSFLSFVLLVSGVTTLMAQNVSTRTNEFEVDFSDPKKLVSTTIPVINWVTPVAETNYAQENKYKIKVEVESDKPIKSITIYVKEDEAAASRGMTSMKPDAGQELKMVVEKSITLMEGENLLEVVAENTDGQKTISYRKVHVGSTGLADAGKLDRTDYALIFATDQYDNWSDLVNPVFDSKTIAEELKKTYGYKVEVIENASQSDVLKKMREYAEKKYKPLDQLFIFFAGHGTYDQTFGEGFVVTKESQLNDEAKTSYLSHNRLRSIVNNVPCEHIFLAMDVCFGGTFDAALASSRGAGAEEVYKEQGQAEFITRKLTYKTRRFLTSGGKTYVSDGIPGKHSPFAKNFLEALRSRGGKDGVLTLPELYTYVERLKIQPRFGEFGDNAPGSDFIFVVK
ncbi:caspase family protein [Fulvivirgaceae bacterium PWU4]|uniref:Caspase family protein n=1 Tax=Chryseosolibacter histidini TaxID=2782349 RepID=A0AAP2DTY3_9BACT|nr:caspase family protein [Chryseosolibacter histidini]MBT1701278.1 caspase family protein [Chryseosolibacter histidini]